MVLSLTPDTEIGLCGSLASWTDAIIEVFYSTDKRDVPVFLDMEDEALCRAAEIAFSTQAVKSAETSVQSAEQALSTVVSAWLNLGQTGSTNCLINFYRLAKNWADQTDTGSRVQRPYWLPLLAVMSRAAEKMQADSDMAANNYYGRLNLLLGLEIRDKRIEKGVRKHSIFLWNCLNGWLDKQDGKRGLPTATVRGHHRFIGLPLSQSLLRESDRKKIYEMFFSAELSPGDSLDPIEMKQTLDDWLIHGIHQPQQGITSLKSAWKQSKQQGVLVAIVSALLSEWKVSTADNMNQDSKKTYLLVRLAREEFGQKPRLSGTFAVKGCPENVLGWQFQTTNQEIIQIFPKRTAGNWTELKFERNVDNSSLFSEFFAAQSLSETEKQLHHNPRPIVPLIEEPALHKGFVENTRLILGRRSMLLVNNSILKNLKDKSSLDTVIDLIAAPGYEKIESPDIRGLPGEWKLYTNIIPLRTVTDEERDFLGTDKDKLDVLFASSSTSLNLSDYLSLPGRPMRLINDAGCTIVATGPSKSPIEISVEKIDYNETRLNTICKDSAIGAISIRLDSDRLTPGLIRIKVKSQDKRTPDTQKTFELVTGEMNQRDTPAPFEDLSQTLCSAIAIIGPDKNSGEISSFTGNLESRVTWTSSKSEIVFIQFGDPGRNSCAVTGSHHTIVTPKRNFNIQECEDCGFKRKTPLNGRLRNSSNSVRRFPHKSIQRPIAQTSIRARSLIDALSWLNGGTSSDLDYLAGQFDESALFEHELGTRLDSLAIIDRKLNAKGSAENWFIRSPELLELPDGSGVQVVGTLNAHLRDKITAMALESGLSVTSFTEGLLGNDIIKGPLKKIESLDFEITLRSAYEWQNSIWSKLPRITDLLDDFDSFEINHGSNLEKFQLETARWIIVPQVEGMGAYRVKERFGQNRYFFTSSDLFHLSRWVEVSASLSKHLVAAYFKRPLMTYDSTNQKLMVPRGAEMPGLYGRLLCLQSGKYPSETSQPFAHAYDAITETTARRVFALFGGE